MGKRMRLRLVLTSLILGMIFYGCAEDGMTGPQGDQGPSGPQGPPGTPGAMGEPGYSMVSTTDDLSDFTQYWDVATGGPHSVSLVDVVGRGVLVGGTVLGYFFQNQQNGNNYTITIRVDGVARQYPRVPATVGFSSDAQGGNTGNVVLPPIRFESSLLITYWYPGNARQVNGFAMVKMD